MAAAAHLKLTRRMRRIAASRGRLISPTDVANDDRGPAWLRHEADERRQEEQTGRGAGRVTIRHLAAGAGAGIDGGLRKSAPAGHAAKEPSCGVREPRREQLLVGPRAWVRRSWRRRGPPQLDSVKLISAMPRAAGPHLREQATGQAERERANRPGSRRRRTPPNGEPNPNDAAMAAPTATRGAGTRGASLGRTTMIAGCRGRRASVGTDVSGRCSEDGEHVLEEPAFVEVNAEQLRYLGRRQSRPNARLEPCQHGVGDEFARIRPKGGTRDQQEPTMTASVDATIIAWAGLPSGATAAISAAVRMPIVVVVLTLSLRDDPRNAYTSRRTSAVYKPACTGRPARRRTPWPSAGSPPRVVRPATTSCGSQARCTAARPLHRGDQPGEDPRTAILIPSCRPCVPMLSPAHPVSPLLFAMAVRRQGRAAVIPGPHPC